MNLPENAIPEDTPPPENEPFWSRFTKRLGYELTKPRTLFRKETAATPTASTWEEIGQHTGGRFLTYTANY